MSAVSSSVTPTSWGSVQDLVHAVLLDACAEGVGADPDRADHQPRTPERAVLHLHASSLRGRGGRDRLGAARYGAGHAPDAVIFDWGGTLTRWHDIDFHAESLALAQAVVEPTTARGTRRARCTRPARWSGAARATTSRARRRRPVHRGRARATTRRCSTLLRVLGAAHAHRPRVRPLWRGAARRGIRVGVLSNTIWPRSTTEDDLRARRRRSTWSTATSTPARSPGPSRRRTPSRPRWPRSGSTDPARRVYVGDRLFDDIWGAQNAGPAGDPRPAQRDPGRAGGPQRGRRRTRWCSGWRDTPGGTRPGAEHRRQLLQVLQCKLRGGGSVALEATAQVVAQDGTGGGGPARVTRRSPQRSASSLPGEYLGSSPNESRAGRGVARRPIAARRRPPGSRDQRGVDPGAALLQRQRGRARRRGGVQPGGQVYAAAAGLLRRARRSRSGRRAGPGGSRRPARAAGRAPAGATPRCGQPSTPYR